MCKIGWFQCLSVPSTPSLVRLLNLKISRIASRTVKRSAHVQSVSGCRIHCLKARLAALCSRRQRCQRGPSQRRPLRPRYSLDISKWLCSVRELVLSAAFSKALPKKLRQEQKYEWVPRERMFTEVEARNFFLVERWKWLPDGFTGAVFNIHLTYSCAKILQWRLLEIKSWAIW